MHRFEHAFHGLNGLKNSDLSYSQHGYGFLVFRREVSRTGQHMVMCGPREPCLDMPTAHPVGVKSIGCHERPW